MVKIGDVNMNKEEILDLIDKKRDELGKLYRELENINLQESKHVLSNYLNKSFKADDNRYYHICEINYESSLLIGIRFSYHEDFWYGLEIFEISLMSLIEEDGITEINKGLFDEKLNKILSELNSLR